MSDPETAAPTKPTEPATEETRDEPSFTETTTEAETDALTAAATSWSLEDDRVDERNVDDLVAAPPVPQQSQRSTHQHGSHKSTHAHAQHAPRTHQAHQPHTHGVDMTCVLLDCPPNFVGRVIGKGGETIKGLQAQSGAHITIDQNFPEGVARKISISGQRGCVQIAVNLVEELLRGGVSAVRNGSVGPGQAQRVVRCPKEMVGRVIGRGGETVKGLQSRTGARIQIDQSTSPCSVTITGNPYCVDVASRAVADVIHGGSTAPYSAANANAAQQQQMAGYGYGEYQAQGYAHGQGYGQYGEASAHYAADAQFYQRAQQMRSMAGAGYGDLGAGYGDFPAAYGQTVGGYGGHTSGGYGEWDGGGYAAVGSEYGTASSYPQTHAQFAGQASYGRTVSQMPQMQQMYPGGALTQGQPLSRDQLDQFQQFQQQMLVAQRQRAAAFGGGHPVQTRGEFPGFAASEEVPASASDTKNNASTEGGTKTQWDDVANEA